jgi:hypothetical protein
MAETPTLLRSSSDVCVANWSDAWWLEPARIVSPMHVAPSTIAPICRAIGLGAGPGR